MELMTQMLCEPLHFIQEINKKLLGCVHTAKMISTNPKQVQIPAELKWKNSL